MKNNYSNSLRIDQWWEPKAGNILAIVFLAIFIFEISFQKSILYLLPSLITIVGIGSFGHLINDLFDLKTDKAAGKKNTLASKSNVYRSTLIIASLVVALVPWFILPFDNKSIYLLIAEFTLLFCYAVPPVRIKTKGFLAILFDALYAYAIPTLLAFYTFYLLSNKAFDSTIFILLFVWQLFVGMHNILIHHVEDFENDTKSGIKTFAINIGKINTRQFILNIIFPLHLLSFGILVFYISEAYWFYYFLFPVLYIAFKLFFVFKQKSFSNFKNSKNALDLQQLNIHYHDFLLYWHLAILIIFNNWFGLIFICILLLFKNSYFIWLLKNGLKHIKSASSLVINYGIYYFRRFILFQNPKKARREHYEEYAQIQEENTAQKNSINIVLVNQNLNKYTETFVDARINTLPYYVHTVYGNGIPMRSNKKGHLISENTTYLRWLKWYEIFFSFGENYFTKKAFTNYLINNNIDLVLAEFGTTAAEIYELCQFAKIPIIVTFHGYDIHHKETLNEHKEAYSNLFEYVAEIICVSKDMENKLMSIGAPKEKLKYLPATFFPENFAYTDHSQNENIFLAIGRFAETKSPHLTILAFKEVLKEIPDARLVMIGKDGGGELFEACHILVKALKIEDKVDFKGILTPTEVKAEMDKAKVFVQHSVTTPLNGDKEGTPVSIMEAMANGLAIVATQHAGIQEMIENNVSGILVDEYDYIQMAKHMIEVCKNETLNLKLGENAAKSIRSNELITNNIQILAELIEKHRLR